MLALILAVLSSFTFTLNNYWMDGDRDPRNFRIVQEQWEQPRE